MLKKISLVLGLFVLAACDPVEPAPLANGVPPSIAVANFKSKCLDHGFNASRQNAAFRRDSAFTEIQDTTGELGGLSAFAHNVLFMGGSVGKIEGAPICGITFAPTDFVSAAYPVTASTLARVIKSAPVRTTDEIAIFMHKGGQAAVIVGDDRQTLSLFFTRIQDRRRFSQQDIADEVLNLVEGLN